MMTTLGLIALIAYLALVAFAIWLFAGPATILPDPWDNPTEYDPYSLSDDEFNSLLANTFQENDAQ